MKKLEDLESMRVITMILVVFAHVTCMYTPKASISLGIDDAFLRYLTEWIYTFHMPAFVAISGAVFYFVKRERGGYNNLNRFISNKAKRLLLPYLFFALFVVIPSLYYCNLIEGDFFRYNIETFLLVRSPRHLWYLVMLFNVLVIFNTFENFIFKHKEIVLILSFLIRPFAYFFPVEIFQLPSTIAYFCYFMLGYYLQYKREYIINYLSNVNRSLLTAILIFLSICIYSLYIICGIPLIIVKITCSILGIAFLFIISNVISENKKITNSTIFKSIDKNNFGLYLFHPMIIYISFFNIKELNINPWISVMIIFILSSILSILLTCFMRIVGLKIFIGEK